MHLYRQWLGAVRSPPGQVPNLSLSLSLLPILGRHLLEPLFLWLPAIQQSRDAYQLAGRSAPRTARAPHAGHSRAPFALESGGQGAGSLRARGLLVGVRPGEVHADGSFPNPSPPSRVLLRLVWAASGSGAVRVHTANQVVVGGFGATTPKHLPLL
jgi:hypothetical protein